MTNDSREAVQGRGGRREPESRRAKVLAAARDLYFERGVDRTSIEDITRAAGVAHGTFYLYFQTKDDAVNAVMADVASEVVARIAVAATEPGVSAVDKMSAVCDALVSLSAPGESPAGDLVAHYHGPEHRDVHDRLAHEVNRQLVPVMASIVTQGVAERIFEVGDPAAAAAFVLSATEGLDLLGRRGSEAATAGADELMRFILRGLGWCP